MQRTAFQSLDELTFHYLRLLAAFSWKKPVINSLPLDGYSPKEKRQSKMRSLALFLLCLLPLSIQAASDEHPSEDIQTGNGFVRSCSDIDAQNDQITAWALAHISSCTGYLMGLHDGITLMTLVANQSSKANIREPFCLPDSATLGQEVRIVLKYIRANPEKAHMDTSLLATKALEIAFPCPTH
jgi:hypothetical protein